MQAVNQSFLAASRVKASKGLWPQEYHVAKGTVLYRFIDSSRASPASGADGPWWFEFEHFQAMRHFASRHGYSLGYTARLFAAILYEWSEVNGVVRAQVKEPLVVWKGRGKQIIVGADRPLFSPEVDARDKNRTKPIGDGPGAVGVSKMTPMQGPLEVYQLYVPGLGKPDNQFASFMTLLGHESIPTG